MGYHFKTLLNSESFLNQIMASDVFDVRQLKTQDCLKIKLKLKRNYPISFPVFFICNLYSREVGVEIEGYFRTRLFDWLLYGLIHAFFYLYLYFMLFPNIFALIFSYGLITLFVVGVSIYNVRLVNTDKKYIIRYLTEELKMENLNL